MVTDMTGARATSALRGTRFGSVRWVAETGSTNADLLAEARRGAAEGLVLVADHQTAGRGRRGRTWLAPPGGSLLMSVLVRPPAAIVALVPMQVSLALVDAVDVVAGVRLTLKWPNDLVAADRKVAGMLTEIDWPPAASRGDPAMVVGVGVNVEWAGRAPDEVAGIAVALDEITGRSIDREDLLISWLQGLDGRYERLLDGSDHPDAVFAAWRGALGTLGRRVRVSTESAPDVEGLAVDVTADGHLVVQDNGGARTTYTTADVVHLRHHP